MVLIVPALEASLSFPDRFDRASISALCGAQARKTFAIDAGLWIGRAVFTRMARVAGLADLTDTPAAI
jgi:hypothetical protein